MLDRQSKNLLIKTEEELVHMRQGGQILGKILKRLASEIRPNQETRRINQKVKRYLDRYQVESAFFGYRGFPAYICVSINEEIVHGVPSSKVIRQGDLVSLDLGIKYKGLITDASLTFPVGKISAKNKKLISATKSALVAGLAKVKDGAMSGDIGQAIEQAAKDNGFGVVRVLSGHGVGHKVHEAPNLPNFGKIGTGDMLQNNMTLAIEPMLVEGVEDVMILDNDWTVVTADRKVAAHFEVTVVVKDNGYEILTPGIID